jgi:hypothetical protein
VKPFNGLLGKLRRAGRPWQIVHFSSMIGAVKKDARSPQGRIYWPRPSGLLIGLGTMNNAS